MNPGRGSARRRATILGGAAVLAGIGAAAWVGLRGGGGFKTPPADLEFASIDGERVTLGALRGRVVLVNFWATTCVICLKEMPELVRLHERLAPRGLETVAVAMPYDRPDFVARYAKHVRLPFRVALDPLGKTTSALGPVRGTPTLLVIDRTGAIVHKIEGAFDVAELSRLLERTLAADGGGAKS